MSTFSSSGFSSAVEVQISSDDGASELSLVNAAYNVVGQGIGELNLALTPGMYQLRQSIGGAEAILDIEVPSELSSFGEAAAPHIAVKLDALKFASPAPIVGSTTFREVPLDIWKKPNPLVGKPGLRLVVRDPGLQGPNEPLSKEAAAHLQAEMSRLSLETMDGERLFHFGDFAQSKEIDNTALVLIDVELSPGHYVLVQSEVGANGTVGIRQRCLPVIVHPDFAPRVYLLSLLDRESQQPVEVNLDKASIMYWPTALGTSPTQPDLTRLEAARKALARGQAIGEYWAATRLSPNEPIQAPMLALLDCYLLLSSAPKPRPIQQSTSAPDNRRPEVQEAINAAGSTFGEDFPDVVAIRCSIANKGIDVSDEQRAFEDTLKAIKLSGPPLLANSWRKLLEPGSTNAELSRVMPFEFVPEATGTWFTWTEEVGARRKGAQNDWGGAIGKAVTQAVGEHAGAALNAAAKGLATLMKDEVVNDLVSKLCVLAAQQEKLLPVERLDPLVVQVINGLGTMQNKLLLDAFGAEELAKKVLLGLRIPSDRLPHLLKSLTSTLEENGLLQGTVKRLAKTLFGAIAGFFTRQPGGA